jgi:hypothetical protein
MASGWKAGRLLPLRLPGGWTEISKYPRPGRLRSSDGTESVRDGARACFRAERLDWNLRQACLLRDTGGSGMATLEERRNEDGSMVYRVKIRLKGRPQVSETFPRKTDARIWAQRTESELRRGRLLGLRRTVAQAIDHYLQHDLIPAPISAPRTEVADSAGEIAAFPIAVAATAILVGVPATSVAVAPLPMAVAPTAVAETRGGILVSALRHRGRDALLQDTSP